MKKGLTLLLCSLFFGSSLMSQITINSDELFDSIGGIYFIGIDTLLDASFDIGDVGEQVWDFSSLEANDTITQEILLAAGTPFEADFPEANLVILEDDTYTYQILDENELTSLGIGALDVDDGDTSSLLIPFDTPFRNLSFPVDLENNFTSELQFTIQFTGAEVGLMVDSIRISTFSEDVSNVDAFGTVMLPNDTVEALRVERASVIFDSTFVYILGEWQFVDDTPADTTIGYTWITNENGWDLPLVNVSIGEDNLGFPAATAATWLTAPNPTRMTSSTFDIGIEQVSLFPNPASEVLNVRLEDHFDGTIEILDFNGKITQRTPINDLNATIDLQGNVAGNHLLVLKNEAGNIAGFKQFVIQ